MAGSQRFPFVTHQNHTTTSNEQLIHLRQMSGQNTYAIQNNALPRHRQRNTPRRILSKLWVLEFSSCTLALGCLLAIVALLRSFDGQPIPQWRFGITLNAVISLLATFMGFFLTLPLSACLGQLKWLRFRQERPLIEFERIESAARGPQGSLALLMRGKGGALSCVGASLVFSILAIGPFTQQILNNSTHVIRSGDASIPVAFYYADPFETEGVLHSDVDLAMKSAVMGGSLSTDDSATQFAVPVKCTTGNCTWPSYTSLAVCASCTDLTDKLTILTPNSTVKDEFPHTVHKLSNGVFLEWDESLQGPQMVVNNTMQPTSSPPASIAYKSHNATILDMFVIALDNETLDNKGVKGPYAAECILEFCAQHFTASVNNGTFIETRLGDGVPIQDYTVAGGKANYELQQGGSNFKVDYNTLKAFWIYLPSLFYGRVSFEDSLSPIATFQSDTTQSIWEHIMQQPHTLSTMFANIELSMTRAVRVHPNGKESKQGSSLVQQIVNRVDWPWISLPAAIVICCLLFLVTVATFTRLSGLEPWKESSLAALFHGIASRDGGKLSALNYYDEMVEAARGMYVRLRSDGERHVLEQTRVDT